MSASTNETPRVLLRISRGGKFSDINARLIWTQDGKPKAMPEEDAHGQIPTLPDGIELDPSQLVPLPDTLDGAPQYSYQSVVHVLPGENLWLG